MRSYEKTINNLAEACHKWTTAKGWWEDFSDILTMYPEAERAVATVKLNILQLDIKDALTELRTHKNLTTEVREELEIRLVTIMILLFDFAGAYKLDLGGSFTKVMQASAANKPKPKAIFIRKGQKKPQLPYPGSASSMPPPPPPETPDSTSLTKDAWPNKDTRMKRK